MEEQKIWKEDTPIQLGDTYYAVGPLQNSYSIETWTYTNDRYDRSRFSVGNVFETKDRAKKFKAYMCNYFKTIKEKPLE